MPQLELSPGAQRKDSYSKELKVTTSADKSEAQGRIHSIETCGTLDGPGIRYIVYTQGCPLSCVYCHNPDCRAFDGGHEVSVESLFKDICRYRSFISSGGLTVSGGEPLIQPRFVRALFKRCREAGIHTALDTSGYTDLQTANLVLEYTDLVLLDIKSSDEATHLRTTGVKRAPIIRFAEHLHQINKPAWIRFVLVPGWTDSPENVRGVAEFVSRFPNVERLEVLPFHKLGEYKWEALDFPYKLKDVRPPRPELIKGVVNVFVEHGINAY